MSEILLQKVLAKLNFLCLEYHADGYFSCVGEPPAWSSELFACIRNRFPQILPIDLSSFLDNFMVDAVEFWQSESPHILRSGYWTESNSAVVGDSQDDASPEVNLEALVLSVDHHHLLLLEVSPVKFDQTLKWLQLARVERLDSLIERKANASQMTSLSLFDPLTGYANEQALTLQLAQWLEQVRQGQISQFVLLKFNVDRFRHVNFTLGFAWGNQVLQQVAQRLKTYIGAQDIVARLGADEFAILARVPTGLSRAAWVEQLMTHLRSPYQLGRRVVHITVSCGLCVIADPAWDGEQCFRHVSFALSQAKALGRGRYVEFESDRFSCSLNIIEQEQTLLRAIYGRSLQASFRPVFSVAKDQIVGCEPILTESSQDHGSTDTATTLESVAQLTNLGLQLAAYRSRICADVLDARPPGCSLLFFIEASLKSLVDPNFLQAIESSQRLCQTGDQWIVKLTRVDSLDPMMLNQVLTTCQRLKLKLCVHQQALSDLWELEPLVREIQYIQAPLNASSVSIQHISNRPIWQGHPPQILWLTQDRAQFQKEQPAIAMKDLDLYTEEHLSSLLSTEALLNLLQSRP